MERLKPEIAVAVCGPPRIHRLDRFKGLPTDMKPALAEERLGPGSRSFVSWVTAKRAAAVNENNCADCNRPHPKKSTENEEHSCHSEDFAGDQAVVASSLALFYREVCLRPRHAALGPATRQNKP
jgi:hypothetical protein